MADVKKRKISKKDWDSVAEKLKADLEDRKRAKFRKKHETIWKEVDRQIMMEPMVRYRKNGQPIDPEWRSVLELGELAKASEIITADVMRLTFPSHLAWFEVHSEIPGSIDPNTGQAAPVEGKAQNFIDRAYRSLMAQQHLDFGLKGRYELSVKEALHHGSYVAEVRWEDRIRYHEKAGLEQVSAPVWVPYSMWNAYPDPSPSVIGTDLFYTGSMFLVDYLPLYLLKQMANQDGWFTENINRVKKQKNTNKDVETEDVELAKLYGDIEIERQDGTIILPNSKVILANGIIVYYWPNELPYPNIIYSGYERMDVRDPYYTSPLIKLSPMQKLGSQMANKLVDLTWMRTEPPIVYDGNDAQMVMDGGPLMAPSSKTPIKNSTWGWKSMEVGDPTMAAASLEFIISQLNQGLGINAIRSGAGNDVSDKTATEITTADVKAEIRTAEFIDKQERHALRPFLFMQHELNKRHLKNYTFYNPEVDAPDFMTVNRKNIPANVVFDVVGSKGALGEQARASRVFQLTAAMLGNQRTASLPNLPELAKMMYQDAGVRNPERVLNLDQQEDPQVGEIKAQAQQIIDEAQGRIAELEKELAISKAVNDARIVQAQMLAEIEGHVQAVKADIQAEIAVLNAAVKANAEGSSLVQRMHDELMARLEALAVEVSAANTEAGPA